MPKSPTRLFTSTTPVRWRLVVWSIAAALLVLPWIAMQFTREVNWSVSDFVIFGTMILAAIFAFEIALRITQKTALRIASALAITLAFVLVWAQLAVGLFD